MLYAMNHPERVEAMFLQSPPCTEDMDRPGWEYNPYEVRLDNEHDVNPSRAEVDKGIAKYATDPPTHL